MSFFKKTSMVLAICALPLSALASENGVTLGFKGGKLDVDGYKDGNTKGASLGYDFGNRFSLEVDLLKGDAGIADVDTKAIYGTYRSEGKGYLLAKLGYIKEEIHACASNPFYRYCANESDSGASYGIGGGVRFNDHFSLEVEYTIIEADVKFLGVGARVKF